VGLCPPDLREFILGRSLKIWVQLGSKTRVRLGPNRMIEGISAAGSTGLWRKRVGVEPTIHPAKGRIAGFEDREDHRTPCASVYRQPVASRGIIPWTQLATAGCQSEARSISNPMLMLFGVNREIGNDSSCLQFFAVFRPAAESVLVRLLSDLVTDLYLQIAICIADVLLFDQ
jgi:hypothetical protein